MRSIGIACLVFASAGCGGGVKVVARPQVIFLQTGGQVRAHVQGQAGLQGQAQVQGEVQVQGQAEGQAQAQVEVQTAVAVPIDGSLVVEFFGVPLDGVRDAVFVFDRSGSMTEPAQGRVAQIGSTGMTRAKLDVAQEELVQALEHLPEGTTVNVIFFNNWLEGYAPQAVPLQTTARDGLISFVKETDASGSTALIPAMRTAFLMNARRVVLLSDGLGNIGGDSSDLLRDAREAMRGGVRIDTIGLGPDQDTELMQALASESGGVYQDLR